MQQPLLDAQIRTHLLVQDASHELRQRYEVHKRRAEAGEVTSQMILVAVFAALAIAVGLIVWNKTTEKAESIPTDTNFGGGGGGGGGGGSQ